MLAKLAVVGIIGSVLVATAVSKGLLDALLLTVLFGVFLAVYAKLEQRLQQ